ALLVALCFVKSVRTAIARNRTTLWLGCWALGGLIFMSLIPSKRPDRIFPIIPPLSLLLVYFIAESGWSKKTVALVFVPIAIVFTAGYTAYAVVDGYKTHQDNLVNFAARARTAAAQMHARYAVVGGKD